MKKIGMKKAGVTHQTITRKLCMPLLLVVCLLSYANESHAQKADKKTLQFFTHYLSGEETYYNNNRTINFADIAKEQQLVWNSWKEANTHLNEEKLIATNELKEKNIGQWNIPEDLEPNAVMPYIWGAKGTMPIDGYPLFIYLHGSGPKESEWESGFRLAEMFEDGPSVYFIPQVANQSDGYGRWFLKGKQYVYEKVLRQALVAGNIDPDRIYMFGISEGGYGSQRLASFYADYLAGAGPMAAGEPLKNAPVENCRNIAFSLRTGNEDRGFYRNILTQTTKDEFEKFQTLYPGSFNQFIELIPEKGHSIDYFPTSKWLRTHKRNVYPTFVSWENYEMDGRYRNGFYNIVVNERSNDDYSSRTYYEMEIDGNDINMRVDEVFYETLEVDPHYGIELRFSKSHKTAAKGKFTVYLCQELVDLNKPVILHVNGKKAFEGKVELKYKHLVNSCATFFDPERIYPAAIEIDLEKL